MSSPVWQPDLADGRYRNPVLHADYSDPDAVRVGGDYYLVASSFNHVPGLPLLHSRDLVNWRLLNHALPRLVPEDIFAVPRHGQGVWAPSIRHHAGRFWVFYGDPDFGLYVVTAENPAGRWSEPVLVRAGKGLIDPCPLWDDDGRVYLVHGWAKSRAGINNLLTLLRLAPDAHSVEAELGTIIEGSKVPLAGFRTLEGPKAYKREGWYYVFAPAGGVATGWQSVFRARSILGPYEHRVVLAQGKTSVNGPHQGALVDTPDGEWWFLHFQDKDAYGRVVHLQPVAWRDGWPVMGRDADGDGTGEPVSVHRKPTAPSSPVAVPTTSDEFTTPILGLQWQWQANPSADACSLTERPDFLRLRCQPEPRPGNLYLATHLLLQKFPAPSFSVTTRLEFQPRAPGECAGLMVFGYNYGWIGLRAGERDAAVVLALRPDATGGEPQQEHVFIGHPAGPVWLRILVRSGGGCRFAFSTDGERFIDTGREFTATCGHWVGAKIGLFASAPATGPQRGHADFDWFRVESLSE